MSSINVLITNGDFLKAMLVMKNIAVYNDIEVHVASESRFAPSFFSKYCKHKLILPNAQKYPDEYIRVLVNYTKKNKIDVLLPINPFEIGLVLENRKKFDTSVNIPFVNYELFNKVNDKWEFQQIINALKLDTPRTLKINPRENLEKINEILSYPVVIKYRISAGSERLRFVKSNLKMNYMEMIKSKNSGEDLPIIQEYIDGENYGAGAFCVDGKVKSIFIYKSLREAKITYGSSTSRVSVIDKNLEQKVRKILEHLNWHGVAHFDVIKKDNKYYFLEMNPRFWLSINLTVKSGLNYPYYLCRINDNIKIPKTYKEGVVSRIILADTLVFLKSLFGKKRYPLKEYFSFFKKNSYFDDIVLSDPLPTLPLIVKFFRGKLI